ncbi:hypothetical protein O3M35_000570 [Rhynocoris fuscipes]
MVLSISTGLAYLHTEIHKQGKWKPCVTHRDINTRNILVKEDLSCCIADLGLAVKITGGRYYNLGEEQHAEAKSINDVGTLRYMAPEVLEGAVNLRDCESSLKQIDVYALGLVIWEISIRVSDFYYKTSDIPEYSLPFEKEIGQHPTLEEMQLLVCRNKARPLFPMDWKNIQATRIVKETVEDCTDQDGEARLTALCVQERISQIYRAVQNGGISPMFNQSSVFSQNCSYNNCSTNLELGDVFIGNDKEVTDGGMSEGTVETMITISPSESFTSNVNYLVKDLWGAVQPYQGRNPCLERNLLSSDSADEVCVVETSRKHERIDLLSETGALVPNRIVTPYYNTIQILQNKSVATPKHVNTEYTPQPLPSQPQKQQQSHSDDSTGLCTRVIVSPFENARINNAVNQNVNSMRPSSLDILTTSHERDTSSFELDGDEDVKRLKELSGRIRTPGDLPPSVRRTRGSRQAARLSLYDDRIMTCPRLVDTTF